jgi:hypothetical protein
MQNIVDESKEAQAHSGKAILKATLTALMIALIILFTTILPAEYGIDPTGIGKMLGFTSLAQDKLSETTAQRHKAEPAAFRQDTVELKFPPREGYEYKFKLQEGAGMIYSWKAAQGLEYDFHGEPEGGPKGYFESYEKNNGGAFGNGSFTAPFTGTHGWYFKNNTGETITVKLTTAGFYEVVGIKGKAR